VSVGVWKRRREVSTKKLLTIFPLSWTMVTLYGHKVLYIMHKLFPLGVNKTKGA
jgi:hypothetical protein